MDKKIKNTQTQDKNIKNESAKLNGVKVNPQDFETPRTTFDMLEQTCQIA